MASKIAVDVNCNSETEEETIAVRKKRSRRVSFAENTSVHIFDRDDEYETPPELKPSSSIADNPAQLGNFGDELGFRKDSSDPNGFKEYSQNEEEQEEDEDDDVNEAPFLRPFESPSSGSGFGSATSNDEEHFFGPVSASFIRPGRLSDSAPSDENHEVTMDSTAFSMNFRSLAKSDSGGDLMTSGYLSFGEKTPTHDSVPTNLGNSMVLTVAKKPNCQSSSPIPKLISGDSNDMSLVGETSHRYDYGRLSPGLDALLAETGKDLHPMDNISISTPQRNMGSKLLPSKEHGCTLRNAYEEGDIETIGTNTQDMPTGIVSVVHDKWGEYNGDSKNSPLRQIAFGFSPKASNAPAPNVSSPIKSTKHMTDGGIEVSNKGDLGRRPGFDSPLNLDNQVPRFDGLTHQEWARSLSSLPTQQRQILSGTASPSKSPWNLTPTQKQAGFFLRNENIIHSEAASSIQKSISKLKMLETSPFSSNLSAKLDSSNIRSLRYIAKTPFPNAGLAKNSSALQFKYVDNNGTEEALFNSFSELQSLSFAQKKGECGSVIIMDDNKIEIPKDSRDVSHAEEFCSPVKDGRSTYRVPAGVLCAADEPSKLSAPVASPSQFTWSAENIQPHLLTSGDPTEGRLLISGDDSSFQETKLNCIVDKKAVAPPHKFVSSAEKRLDMKSSALPEYLGSLSIEKSRKHVSYNEFVDFGAVNDVGPRGNSVRKSMLTTSQNKLGSILMQSHSSSPIADTSNFKGLTEVENLDDREINLVGHRNSPGIMRNFPTPSKDKKSPNNIQSRTPERNLQTEKDQASLLKDLSGSGIIGASPFAHTGAVQPSVRKNLVELFAQSPSLKEHVTHNYNVRSNVVEGVQSPKPNQLTDGDENSFARKRRNEEMTLQDRGHVDGTERVQRSPKLHKSGIHDPEVAEGLSKSKTGASTSGNKMKHWVDIYSKFSEDSKNLLSLSVHKLNLRVIDVLEDILVHLQRSKTYGMLCKDMQSQKSVDPLNNLGHKRIAETKLLLHKLVHEQAKLQIMHVKRERLLKTVQVLRSGIQESQILMHNHFPRGPEQSVHLQANNEHPQPFDHMQSQVALEKVTAMGKVLEESERRITNLTKSLRMSCKLKGESDCADTIFLVKDHLMRRTGCRFIRLDMQLWDVDNLESGNGYHNVVLNYLGFIKQRLAVNFRPVSSISISNKLNNVNITKNLPDMDACAAFTFLLNAEITQKYVSPRSLAQETQISSSLIGNLLDVVEEVQLARIELRNLIESTFCSQSVVQLYLQLSFIDFKSAKKVMLTLDMSCLKCGVYPSEILPSQMVAPADEIQNSSSKQLLAEITAAFQNLRAGYLRIIRLCRCVSQVIEASSR